MYFGVLMTSPVQSKRIEYLDSIRGIAAMMVVIYHFIGWHWGENIEYKLASFIFNGSDAVSFFFVLSGFVLSYKYLHSDKEIQIKKFTFNRIFRLYPAFVLTVLFNYLYWNRQDLGFGILKDIFLDFNRPLWTEFAMVRNHHKFYIPGWTLGVEMALSLLMPFLTIVAKKNIKLIVWFIPLSMMMGPGYINTFTMHFCLGIILSYYYPQIRDFNFRESKYYAYRWLIAIGTFILFSIRHIERIVDFGSLYDKIADFLKLDLFHFTGFASFLILLWIINSKKIQDFLQSKFFIFIGKISYSVYLMHWLIVVAIMEHWDIFINFFGTEPIAFVVMLLVTILATIASATIMYYGVEEPFIKWSKKRSAKMS